MSAVFDRIADLAMPSLPDNDRRARVRLAAAQRGLRYLVTVDADATGHHREQHRLTADRDHPETSRPPWDRGGPILVAGQVLVPGVQGDTLNDCETYLGVLS